MILDLVNMSKLNNDIILVREMLLSLLGSSCDELSVGF